MTPPAFETILPEIESRSRRHYAHCDPQRREECVQESVCQAFALYDSAVQRGNHRFTPCTLTWFANRAVDEGRKFAGYTTTDALDRGRAIGFDDLDSDGWSRIGEALVQRQTPVFDQARIRIDWRAFASTLTERERWMVEELAVGSLKTEIAREAGLSNGRISQILGDVAEQYEEYFGTPGFEVRARRQGRAKLGRNPNAARAA